MLEKIILSVIVVTFVIGSFICEAKQGRILVGDSDGGEPQFESISFHFRIYTIRHHDYLVKEDVGGIVHLASCRCKKKGEGNELR